MLDFLFAKKKPLPTISFEGGRPSITVRAKETILESALREGVRFPNDCRVGGCGTCKCRLLSGAVTERTDKAYVLSREELAAGYVLACQSVPKTDVRVALDAVEHEGPQHEVVRTEGVIATRRKLTHDIVELVIETEAPVTYTAGQYARLALPALSTETRAYSFARAPRNASGEKELVFYVRAVPGGALSPELVHGRETRVVLEGPFGDFRLRESAAPIFALAGGSGLAPIRALAEDVVRHKLPRPFTLLFGARTERDLYELDALIALGRDAQAAFTVIPVLSHESTSSPWRGARGLVTEHIGARIDPHAEAYLCGPPAMIDAAISELARFGLREDRIFFDKFTDMSHAPSRA